jgi:hypothetical protein
VNNGDEDEESAAATVNNGEDEESAATVNNGEDEESDNNKKNDSNKKKEIDVFYDSIEEFPEIPQLGGSVVSMDSRYDLFMSIYLHKIVRVFFVLYFLKKDKLDNRKIMLETLLNIGVYALHGEYFEYYALDALFASVFLYVYLRKTDTIRHKYRENIIMAIMLFPYYSIMM